MANPENTPKEHDLLIIGGGPAGLAAATYGASERLKTGVTDQDPAKFGGQAGTSTLIENYPGFDQGVTGPELMQRMAKQANRLGATAYHGTVIDSIERTDRGLEVSATNTEDGKTLYIAKNVLLANGVQYNRHPAANLDRFLGRGVAYGSPDVASKYKDEELFVVGGANSAGQAAYALSDCEGCTVHMLVRGKSLEDKMSGYLIDKIKAKNNIIVHLETDLTSVDGGRELDEVVVTDRRTGQEKTMPANHLFVMIGAHPRTMWLPEDVQRDKHNYVVTGNDLDRETRGEFEDQYERPPLARETSMEGLFAAGDVVSGSQKRVASAVGAGADSVGDIHKRNAHIEQHGAKNPQ